MLLITRGFSEEQHCLVRTCSAPPPAGGEQAPCKRHSSTSCLYSFTSPPSPCRAMRLRSLQRGGRGVPVARLARNATAHGGRGRAVLGAACRHRAEAKKSNALGRGEQ